MAGPRIAIGGFMIECNRFAPVTPRESFTIDVWHGDDALLKAITEEPAFIVGEYPGFFAAMEETGGFSPVPLFDARSHPNGPVDALVFAEIREAIATRLRAAVPVDGVFLVLHGAAIVTDDLDPEGTILADARAIVGPDIPIVATLDLHANVSTAMVESADVLVAYRTNPHTDQNPRGREAGGLMRRLLAGERFFKAHERLPISPPTVTMLTRKDTGPFSDMMAAAEGAIGGPLASVSVIGSFPHTDTPHNGIAVLAYGADQASADRTVREIATIAWEGREGFAPTFASIEDALDRARRAWDGTSQRIALADLGDNPAGGALGTRLELIQALIDARPGPTVCGLVHAPQLAASAHDAGIGGSLAWPDLDQTLTVVALSDGRTRGRRGLLAGAPIDLGPTAALRISELVVVVSTHRFSPNDPMCFEHLGLDLAAFRVIVLKSRGHFRAGFDELVEHDNVVEVATPGLTSPDFASFEFRDLPRPSWPLDRDVSWTPSTVRSEDAA